MKVKATDESIDNTFTPIDVLVTIESAEELKALRSHSEFMYSYIYMEGTSGEISCTDGQIIRKLVDHIYDVAK